MGQDAPGCLGAVFRLFGLGGGASGAAEADVSVYRVRDDFLSPAEARFFRVLRLVAADDYIICPKVRLGDILFVTRPNENRGALNRIAARHLDFLVCDASSLKPVLGVELDDSSHRRAEAAETDRFKDAVFRAATLPLLRVPVRESYEVAQIAAMVQQALSGHDPPVRPPMPRTSPARISFEETTPVPPQCPKCGTALMLRTAQRGERMGTQFWGCPNYPRCREVVPFEER
jgi:hypothetical protein